MNFFPALLLLFECFDFFFTCWLLSTFTWLHSVKKIRSIKIITEIDVEVVNVHDGFSRTPMEAVVGVFRIEGYVTEFDRQNELVSLFINTVKNK